MLLSLYQDREIQNTGTPHHGTPNRPDNRFYNGPDQGISLRLETRFLSYPKSKTLKWSFINFPHRMSFCIDTVSIPGIHIENLLYQFLFLMIVSEPSRMDGL